MLRFATEGGIYSGLELIKDSGCSWFYLHADLVVCVSCKRCYKTYRTELVSERKIVSFWSDACNTNG
jgi:hypothetical protein